MNQLVYNGKLNHTIYIQKIKSIKVKISKKIKKKLKFINDPDRDPRKYLEPGLDLQI